MNDIDLGPDLNLLMTICAFLAGKNGRGEPVSIPNDVYGSLVATTARQIIATGDARFTNQALPGGTLKRLAAGQLQDNERRFPRLVAASLLWADTWKQGS